MQYLSLAQYGSVCEWKGRAQYYDVTIGNRKVTEAAWFYANPSPAFVGITNYVAFYAGKMDSCYVGEELARPQPGNFYGGWITNDIVGPFKGEPGTMFW
jgi:uncharacterized protein (DUF427 family)